MLDLTYHLLSNDAAVNTAVSGRITTDLRVQTEDTPAVVMDWLATNEIYSNLDTCRHSLYTVDILVYTKDLPTCSDIMGKVMTALDRYTGTVTPATGNTYNVVNISIQNRNFNLINDRGNSCCSIWADPFYF